MKVYVVMSGVIICGVFSSQKYAQQFILHSGKTSPAFLRMYEYIVDERMKAVKDE